MKKLLSSFLFACLSFVAFAQLPAGSTAPDFTATDINGRTWRLYDILESGRPVVLDISATWCGPCWNYHNANALKTYYNAHGPAGDGKSMVFFVEGDASTNLNCLYGPTGCNSTTLGDWTAGKPYPIFENAEIADKYALAYYPTLYLICPDKTVKEVGQLTAANHWTQASACVGTIPANWGKVSTMSAGSRALEFCGGQRIGPSIDVTNLGTSPITSMKIKLSYNGIEVQSHDFSGNLTVLSAATVAFDSLDIAAAGVLRAEITEVNGQPNGNASVFEYTIAPAPQKYTGNKVEVRVRTDANGKDTYWAVFDDNGKLFDQGGNQAVGINGGGQYPNGSPTGTGAYANSTTIKDTISVPGECFSFVLVDGRGDGFIAPGNVKLLTGTNSFQSFAGNVVGSRIARAFSEITSGVGDFVAMNSLELFPNPATDELTIQFESINATTLQLEVVNALGQTVLSQKGQAIAEGNQSIQLPVAQLSNGLYYLQLRTADGQIAAKPFVVAR